MPRLSFPALCFPALCVPALLTLAASPAAGFEMPPRDSFGASVERPLFFPGRRAAPTLPSAAPAEAMIPAAMPRPGMRLVGLALDQRGGAVAVLRAEGADGPERRVVAGEIVQGWTISQVGRGGMTLSLGARHASVAVGGTLPAAPE